MTNNLQDAQNRNDAQ